MDWSKSDHILGCGTTIRHKTLDLLGMPRAKQHIAEVYRWVPRMWDGHFPRLTGRVAVVDESSAKLCDGDVVSVMHSGCVGRERPVCVVVDPLVPLICAVPRGRGNHLCDFAVVVRGSSGESAGSLAFSNQRGVYPGPCVRP